MPLKDQWRRVTKDCPCPICEADTWCLIAADGSVATCMRIDSGPTFIKHLSEGHLHRCGTNGNGHKPTGPPDLALRLTPVDWDVVQAENVARVDAPTNAGKLEDLAACLAVLPSHLRALGIGRNGVRWTFPERGARGGIIGMSTRHAETGEKKCTPGSRRGLTMCWPMPTDAGSSPTEPVLLVEGVTDVAAAMGIGYTAIGRPSNVGGVDILKDVVKGLHVVVVGENDQKPTGQWPGRDGVAACVKALNDVAASLFVVFPPDGIKDLRQWCERQQAGDIRAAIAAAKPFEPPAPQQPPPALVLDPTAPMPDARQFISQCYTHPEGRTLHHHAGDWLGWMGSHYAPIDPADMRALLYAWSEPATCAKVDGRSGNVSYIQFKPNKAKIENIADALRGVANVPATVPVPSWLTPAEGLPAAAEVLACRNGLLDMRSMRLLPHTPLYLGTVALPYNYDPGAIEPREWYKFLESLWPEDPDSIQTLQEWFGYTLTTDTRQQKIMLMVGPKRSGKGTITRIQTALLGSENVTSPTMAGLTTPFGKENLIGKQLATVTDARMSGRTDAAIIAETLLSISGEDMQTVPRKFKSDWIGRLTARFSLLSNELPRLTDASGALASRFIVLQMDQSFLGREDMELERRLMGELSGILNWSLAGWRSLTDRGRFAQPQSAESIIQELEDLASPIGAFVRDCCEVGPGHAISCSSLFVLWKNWCASMGRDHPGTVQSFCRDIRASVQGIKDSQPRTSDGRERVYEGIGERIM